MIAALGAARGPIVNVRSFVPEEALLALYNVADAVLANSGREPFGLVGLEVMAAGGLAVTGSTGEDYVRPFENAIACDTGDPRELAAYLDQLAADPALATRIRAAGIATSHEYTWPRVLQLMAFKLSS
jgi:glycosyltransferase involved in cell wall biosynthesis